MRTCFNYNTSEDDSSEARWDIKAFMAGVLFFEILLSQWLNRGWIPRLVISFFFSFLNAPVQFLLGLWAGCNPVPYRGGNVFSFPLIHCCTNMANPSNDGNILGFFSSSLHSIFGRVKLCDYSLFLY